MKNVRIFGDSIGKGVVFDEERRRYVLAKDRCLKLLERQGIQLDNHTRFGATLEDGYEDFCGSEIRRDDIVVIEFGGNDCDMDWQAVSEEPEKERQGRLPLAQFSALLNQFIRDVRDKGAMPLLVTPPPLLSSRYYQWVSRGKNGEAILQYLGDVDHIYRWQEMYANAVRETAWRQNTALVDLRQCFLQQQNLPELMCVDGIHPNEAGQRLMAEAILQQLPDLRQPCFG